MSINSAMLAGVSGLVANSSALAAISDNISNVNTTGYKRNQVNFATVVTAQAVQGRYSAGGVTGVTRQYVSQQGLVQTASSPTDLAISGDGFFITSQKGSGLTSADARLFTRAGSFAVDSDGYMVNDAKLYLLGWPAQANGQFDVSPSDMSKLQPINVKGLGTAVTATTGVAVSANLNSGQTVSPAEAAYNAGSTSMADYADDPATGTRPDFSMEVNVIDSQGATRKIAVAFLKDSSAANKWHAEIYAVPASSVSTAGPSGQLAAGDVLFDQNGNIDLANSTLFGSPAPPSPTLSFGASGSGTDPSWATSLGVAAQNITFDLSKFTQLAQPSTVTQINSDGAGVGNVVGVQVSDDGIVSAVFDNSQVRQIAKIALGTFPNADGLQSVSGNAYRSSMAAGELVIKEPGLGAGSISPSSLEASTVDLSAEFTGLITTQKAYSASSKIISTADQMLEELLSMKR